MNMDEEVKIKFKFKCVLSELAKKDYKVTDDTILEKLITHLSTKEAGSQIIDVPSCSAWVGSIISSWLHGKTSATITSFALRLMSIILENESHFINIQNSSVLVDNSPFDICSSGSDFSEHLREMILKTSRGPANFSLKCALINLLSSLLKHSSGRQWVMDTGLWNEIHEMSLTDSSIYVVREARRFLSVLLNDMPLTQETEAEIVMARFLEPIVFTQTVAESLTNNPRVNASLYLISEILQNSFLSCNTETNYIQSPVVSVIYKERFGLLPRCLAALKLTKCEEQEELLSKIAILMYILDVTKFGNQHKIIDLKDQCLLILDVFNILIEKLSIENVLKLCVLCHNHWRYVAKVYRKEECQTPSSEETKYKFEDQLLCFQLAPLFCCIASTPLENDKELYLCKLFNKTCFESQRLVFALRDAVLQTQQAQFCSTLSARYVMHHVQTLPLILPLYVGLSLVPDSHSFEDEITEAHILKITSLMNTTVQRIIYIFRNAIIKRGLNERVALLSVSNLLSLKRVLDRDRAVLVFQSFIYVLKHFVVCAESGTKQGGWGGEFRESHHSTLLVAILDGLANLIRSHRITWRESVESLCLLTLAQELLDNPTFSSKVVLVVRALHLIQLCIENFMPPNLALLTNSLNGSSFDQLGPLIFKRLHDPHWEVRDSSLEVLHTLATISLTKYPLFQDLILDNKLCELVAHLAVNDAENYVCASATKCLTAMVQVDRLWNEELCDKDLVNKMIGILNGESEGVLRREASLLMSQIFKNRKVSPDVLHKMCVTMANVVLSDLHWEVKVNALNFWELIIEHQMNDQGMIDGVFPQVTFSKENRKIINLTPSAIHDRLKKVLGELSENGCLHVLLEATCKDEDLEVIKKASQIIISLSQVLEQHGLLQPKSQSVQTSPILETSLVSQTKEVVSTKTELEKLNRQTVFSGPSDIEMLNSEQSKPFDEYGNSGVYAGKSILDLDPQAMGFAVLDDVKFDIPGNIKSDEMQDKVIDSILNDRDINLLANVYLGTGVELPGRQGPETKVIRPLRPLVILSSDEYLNRLATLQVDEIVKERSRWIEDTGNNLLTLLDDMLIMRSIDYNEDDEFNIMDCY